MMKIFKQITLWCTCFLLCQALIYPLSHVYAEIKEPMDEEVVSPSNNFPLANIFEENELSSPRFSWEKSYIEAYVHEEVDLTLFSEQEIDEVRIILPQEATILDEKLSAEILIEKGVSQNEWVINSLRTQRTFSLPIIFEEEGAYEVKVEDSTTKLQILAESEHPTDDSIDKNENEEVANQRNNVSVGDFTSLQRAISNATANTETIITITNSFAFTSRLNILQGRNIRLQATTPRTLTNLGPHQHFLVQNGQLTLSDNVILDGGGVRVVGSVALFTLDGGIIQHSVHSDGGGIDVSGGGHMIINDGMIKDPVEEGIFIWDGTVTMNGGILSGGTYPVYCVRPGSGIFIMNGGIIEKTRHGALMMEGNSTAIIRDGIIRDSELVGIGIASGAVNATLRIEGGLIENTADAGIWIDSDSTTVTQSGGTIKNSRNSGVKVLNGTFSMTGGLISENKGDFGAGIYVGKSGQVDLSNGEIKNNQASIGGGIYFEMLTTTQKIFSGVEFSGNQADNYYAPPWYVEQAFPNMLSRSSSITEYNHPLNGYDIDYETSNPHIITLATTSNIENAGKVFLNNGEYSKGQKMIENTNVNIQVKSNIGYRFVSWEIISGADAKIADVNAETTTLTTGSSDVVIQANYEEIKNVNPLDPLDPDKEVDPNNPSVLPEGQGLVSIDFVSQFNFGEVPIQAGKATYEALPQRLLDEDGTINNEEERPNYVQISDRRSSEDRGGWSLSATLADEGFKDEEGEILRGAEVHLTNQELTKPTSNPSDEPHIVRNNGAVLAPGNGTRLLDANSLEGQGTWIYRFGNRDNAESSVKLEVPTGANPKATSYQATINWELSSVPGN